MVNAKQCDRCQEIYGDEKTIILKPLEIWQDESKKDLCHRCEKDLESFYSYEFEGIEDIKKLLKKKK